MENFKVWAPLVLLSVLVGGIFLYRHLELVDAANVGYMTARESLRIAEDSLKAQTTRWESISTAVGEANAKLKVATDKAEKAAATLAEAQNAERKHLEDLDYMTGAFLGLVEKARAKAIGTTLPTVVLQDGKQLTNAQIKRVDDKGVSFFHSEGSGFVEADNLPADLQSKLDLGSGSIERKAASLKSGLMDAGKTGGSMPPAVSSSSTTAPTTPAKPSVNEEKLKRLRLQIVDIEAKTAASARNRDLWLTAAEKYSIQASDAAFRGVPTSKHRADEAAARNQAALLNQQIGVLEAEAARLRVEEESLLRQ
jgi:hypothetical protein